MKQLIKFIEICIIIYYNFLNSEEIKKSFLDLKNHPTGVLDLSSLIKDYDKFDENVKSLNIYSKITEYLLNQLLVELHSFCDKVNNIKETITKAINIKLESINYLLYLLYIILNYLYRTSIHKELETAGSYINISEYVIIYEEVKAWSSSHTTINTYYNEANEKQKRIKTIEKELRMSIKIAEMKRELYYY